MACNLSLLDMPNEILCSIVALLDHPRDVAACARVSTALGCASPLDAAVSYYWGRSEMALADGLPLRVASTLFARWGVEPERRHLPAAASGGRADVVRWVCHRIKEHQPAPWANLGAPGLTFGPAYAPAPDPYQYHGRNRVGRPGANQSARARAVRGQDLVGLLGSTDNDGAAGPSGHAGLLGHPGIRGTPGLLGYVKEDDDDDHDTPAPPVSALPALAPVATQQRQGWWNVPPVRRHRGPSQGPPDSAAGSLTLLGDTAAIPHMLQAVYESAQRGHVDILRYLTTACPLAKMPCVLDVQVVVEAARRGVLATVMYAHDRWPQYVVSDDCNGTACCCPAAVAHAAIEGNQHHVLQWMRAVGCQAFACTAGQLATAIRTGNDLIVDVITRTLVDEATAMNPGVDVRGVCCVDERALADAAQEGHVRALAIAHARGFASMTADVLSAAATMGKLDVLRWAAGEVVPGVESRFSPLMRLPWHDRIVAWSAAEAHGVNTTVVDWLAAQPETRRHFDAVMARTMLARNRPAVALWMRDAGLASLSDWESLETAITGGVTCLDAMIDRGAVCSPRAMAAALMHAPNADAVALLCKRCGYDSLYEALQTHVHAIDNEAIRWVRDNVPDVDVDHIIEPGQAHASIRGPERSPAGRRATIRQPSGLVRVRLPNPCKPRD
nr:hypothetical protein [Pandoravirus aubagnensis]